ncbi:MAG TPA: amidase [Rhodopila sp.]|nr:amidase [Rhodopila sp.]
MQPTSDAAGAPDGSPDGATRRGVVAGMGAAAASAALHLDHAQAADNDAGNPYQSATELTRALAAREVSSRALVDAAIARIEALDGRINAVVVRDFDRARAAADAADAALAKGRQTGGEQRPLLGLPMTVKEQLSIVGLPTTWGFEQFRGWQPQADALAVQRLKQAGAVILGKTNVPVGLADWQSYNPIYGTTNNPWDLGRTPGGSSGGSAAALAAGYVPLEVGSDIGGSLRAPAHYCGIFSHRPSIGLIPLRGAGPPETPPIPVPDDMAVLGPMARSAADLALALGVLAGPDEMWDGIGYRLALPPPRHERLADFRVLVLDEHPLFPTAAEVRTVLNEAADRLAQAGAQVRRAGPDLPDLARMTRDYVELLMAFFAVDMPPEVRLRMEAAAQALPPEDLSLRAASLRGVAMSHAAWVRSMRIRQGVRAQWQAMFRQVDVILCPPMPTAAFPHDHTPMPTRHLMVDGRKVAYDDQIVWAALSVAAGLPATTMPAGQTPDGLPVGVQIIGGYLEDHTTIRLAALMEQAFGGFRPPPKLG